MHYFCELNGELAVSHLQELPRPSPPWTTRSWNRFAVLKATSPTLFHLLRAPQRRASSLPFYWWRKNAKAAFTPCKATKQKTRRLRPRRPLAVSGRLPPSPGFIKKKLEMPAALRGQALQRTPPFLESSFPPTAMSGGHAGPVGRLFFLAAAAAALPPHSPFLLFLPSLPPWASGQSRGPWGRAAPWPVCRVPFTRPLRRSWKKREARTASWERSVRPAHAPPLSSAGPALSPGGLVCEASREGAVRAARTELTMLELVDRWGGSIGLGLLSSCRRTRRLPGGCGSLPKVVPFA